MMLFLAHCNRAPQPLQTGFYYWKTQLSLSPFLQKYLHDTHCSRLFVKFADIARNPATGEIEPYSLLSVSDTTGLYQWPVVPCFFITNPVFQQMDESGGRWLSERIVESLESVGSQWGKNARQWPEIQIDCDWTASTRVPYFRFLKRLQQLLPDTRLNITIRLHQYSNPDKTGVPPASRGTLMCYNTGDIEDINTRNSIFDVADAEHYRAVADYPLPLDLALPMFSWALIYRDGALWKIIPEAIPEQFADTTRYKQNDRLFIARKATFTGGHYLRPGDEIRVETITPESLNTGLDYIRGLRRAPDATLLMYHLDSMAVERFPAQAIRNLISAQLPGK